MFAAVLQIQSPYRRGSGFFERVDNAILKLTGMSQPAISQVRGRLTHVLNFEVQHSEPETACYRTFL